MADLSVDTAAVLEAAHAMHQIARVVEQRQGRVLSAKRNLDIQIQASEQFRSALGGIAEALQDQAVTLELHASFLRGSAEKYDSAESSLLVRARGQESPEDGRFDSWHAVPLSAGELVGRWGITVPLIWLLVSTWEAGQDLKRLVSDWVEDPSFADDLAVITDFASSSSDVVIELHAVPIWARHVSDLKDAAALAQFGLRVREGDLLGALEVGGNWAVGGAIVNTWRASYKLGSHIGDRLWEIHDLNEEASHQEDLQRIWEYKLQKTLGNGRAK